MAADEIGVPVSEWRWFGNAGHFILGHDCRFHLTTLIGPWLVSTVGQKIGYEKIGYKRTFETMVFRAGAPCTAEGCGCGLPTISGSELDARGYNDAGAATRGHYELCEEWAERSVAAEETADVG